MRITKEGKEQYKERLLDLLTEIRCMGLVVGDIKEDYFTVKFPNNSIEAEEGWDFKDLLRPEFSG